MATLYDVIGSGNLRTEFLLDEKRRISSVLYMNVCVFTYQEGPQCIPFPLYDMRDTDMHWFERTHNVWI